MTATADSIIERRRLRRRLAFWRILAIIAVVVAILAIVPWRGGGKAKEHLARVEITGVIVNDRARTELLEKLAENERVKAVLVRIESPGGTVVGSETLFDGLREIAETKPVVALLGEAATSGGYVAAIGADRIFARRNTITGSIGVVSSVPDATALLERIGISFTEVKSSPLKAAPNPVEPHSEAAIDALEELVEDSYGWFRGLVAERRGLEGAALDRVADGRLFTGGQALDLGLVDAIGGEAAARDWLASEHGVSADLEVRGYRWGEEELPFPFDRLREGAEALFGPAATLTPSPRLLAIHRD